MNWKSCGSGKLLFQNLSIVKMNDFLFLEWQWQWHIRKTEIQNQPYIKKMCAIQFNVVKKSPSHPNQSTEKYRKKENCKCFRCILDSAICLSVWSEKYEVFERMQLHQTKQNVNKILIAWYNAFFVESSPPFKVIAAYLFRFASPHLVSLHW